MVSKRQIQTANSRSPRANFNSRPRLKVNSLHPCYVGLAKPRPPCGVSVNGGALKPTICSIGVRLHSRLLVFFLFGRRPFRSLPSKVFPFLFRFTAFRFGIKEKTLSSLSCLAPCLGQFRAGIPHTEQPKRCAPCPAHSRPNIADISAHRHRQESRSILRPLRSRQALGGTRLPVPLKALRPSPASIVRHQTWCVAGSSPCGRTAINSPIRP